MGEDDWLSWDPDKWNIRRKYKLDDITRARQLKPAEELDRSDVLGERHHIKGVYCKVCEKEWRRGAINVCKDCIEYYCDEHISRHPECKNGR